MLTFSRSVMFLSIALELLVIAKLYKAGLIRQYMWFTWMLVTGFLRDGLLSSMDPNTDVYQTVWLYTLIPYALSQIAAAVSAYFRLAGLYTGIGRFAGWLYFIAVASGLCACLALNHYVGEPQYSMYAALGLLFERSIAIILTGSAVLVFAFLTRFPSPLQKMPHNFVYHLVLLTSLFTLTSLFQLILGIVRDEHLSRAIEGVFFSIGSICYTLWIVLLRSEGELMVSWPDTHPDLAEKVRNLDAELIQVAGQMRIPVERKG